MYSSKKNIGATKTTVLHWKTATMLWHVCNDYSSDIHNCLIRLNTIKSTWSIDRWTVAEQLMPQRQLLCTVVWAPASVAYPTPAVQSCRAKRPQVTKASLSSRPAPAPFLLNTASNFISKNQFQTFPISPAGIFPSWIYNEYKWIYRNKTWYSPL